MEGDRWKRRDKEKKAKQDNKQKEEILLGKIWGRGIEGVIA